MPGTQGDESLRSLSCTRWQARRHCCFVMWVALSHNVMQLPTAASCFCCALSALGGGTPLEGCATAASWATTSEENTNAVKRSPNVNASSVLCFIAIALNQIRNVALILVLLEN